MQENAKTRRKELLSLLKLAKKHGLQRIKSGDVEIEFASAPTPQGKPNRVNGMSNLADLLSDGIKMPADDEMLYRSTPYFDELTAQREGDIPPAGGPHEKN